MSDEKQQEGNVEATINAVTGLVKEVPIYQDAIQPLAKETGKALQTVGQVVNAVLIPIRGLVWGIEKIEDFVQTRVSKKLENVPVEDIQTPDPSVAGPALESLRYTGHKESLSELYANLLASSMDRKTAKNAHPGFVEIIRNLSSDEAKIMTYLYQAKVAPIIDIRKAFKKEKGEITIHDMISAIGFHASTEHRDLTASYLVNLERLGLIRMDKGRYLTAPDRYKSILEDPPVVAIIESLDKSDDGKSEIVKYFAEITALGRQFGDACIANKNES